MTLVDSSVWVDHFRKGDPRLTELLDTGAATTHEFVVGELMCGNLRERDRTLEDLQTLPHVTLATRREVLYLMQKEKLFGLGLGWIDMHLLAGAKLSGALLYTRDRALAAAAERVGGTGGFACPCAFLKLMDRRNRLSHISAGLMPD